MALLLPVALVVAFWLLAAFRLGCLGNDSILFFFGGDLLFDERLGNVCHATDELAVFFQSLSGTTPRAEAIISQGVCQVTTGQFPVTSSRGQFGLVNPGREVTMKALESVIIGGEIAEESDWPIVQADR